MTLRDKPGTVDAANFEKGSEKEGIYFRHRVPRMPFQAKQKIFQYKYTKKKIELTIETKEKHQPYIEYSI